MKSEHVDRHAGPMSMAEIVSIAERVDLSVLNQKRILVTGAQGLIGNFLSQALAEAMATQGLAPSRLFLQSRRQPNSNQNWTRAYGFAEPIVFPLDYSEVFPHVDVVIHAASPASPSKYESAKSVFAPNISGVVSALAFAPIPERFLLISSGEVYGLHREELSSSQVRPKFQPSGTRASYPNAKLVAEKIVLDACSPDTRFNIARLFHTFGPGIREDDGRSFADFLHHAARGKAIRLYSEGEDIRNFAYIEDSIAGLLHILVSDSNGEIFDVGGRDRVSIREFAEVVARHSHVKVTISDASSQAGRVPTEGLPPVPSFEPLSALGWTPRVSLDEGVLRTLRFIRRSLV